MDRGKARSEGEGVEKWHRGNKLKKLSSRGRKKQDRAEMKAASIKKNNLNSIK